MFGILARLLEILYSIWPSYGGSIILFTIVIMIVLAPLTFKSTRSMLAMQALQPEVKKLQNRYKDDRQKLNEEMMKFYRENKISPLGGCLPMLIQLPVFFILYEVLYKLTLRGPFGMDLGHSAACSANGVNLCTSNGNYANAGFFDPAYLKHSSQLYQDLTHTRVMDFLGIDLSQNAMSSFSRGLAHALPYIVMVLIVIGLTYLQQQQIQSRQPNKSDQNPTQQLTMKIMPIVMGFIYIVIPAGVVLYFLVSSLFRIGQQSMVTRTFYTGPNAVAIPTTATEEDDAEEKPPKSFWDQFKPSTNALPQVGKKAAAARKGTTTTAERSKAAGGSAKSGGSGRTRTSGSGTKSKRPRPGASSGSSGKSATKKASGSAPKKRKPSDGSRSRSGANGGSGAKGSGRNGGDQHKKRPPEASGPNASDASQKRKPPSRSAPSRKAPSRKAPGRPDDKD